MQQPSVGTSAEAARVAGQKRPESEQPQVAGDGLPKRHAASASGVDDNVLEEEDGAGAQQPADGAAEHELPPQGPLLDVVFPALFELNTGFQRDISALTDFMGAGLNDIADACKIMETRAVAASLSLEQSICACEQKQQHYQDVWLKATEQLQRALAGELFAPGAVGGSRDDKQFSSAAGEDDEDLESASLASRANNGGGGGRKGAEDAAAADDFLLDDDGEKDDDDL